MLHRIVAAAKGVFDNRLRTYNKMTLHSSGLFSVRTASGCIDNTVVLPVSPLLPDEKTLAFVATIRFVRGLLC